jgi:hypothetical protein
MLENEAGLSKGDFNLAETVINECRTMGLLPIDFTACDSSRAFDCLEFIGDELDIEADAEVTGIIRSISSYSPQSFWADQHHYCEMLVEKIDLKTLFAPICKKYHVPIANAKGWSDMNQRFRMIRRFSYWEGQGKQPVLLYCGDFDPVGMKISETLRKNLADLEQATGWRPENLVVDRFGLNLDLIEDLGLTWIDGLATGSGEDLANPTHRHHKCAYVQNWLAQYGAWKVEANALVVRPDAGRTLCEDAINEYVSPEAPARFEARMGPARRLLLNAVRTDLPVGTSAQCWTPSFNRSRKRGNHDEETR